MNTTTVLRALVMLAVMPAVAWANAGPPHVPGRLIGEPNGLESVAIKHERLTFDLRPLAGGGSAQVEALYTIENTGEERTVDLVFVSGPMVSDSAAVVLDDQPIAAVWKKVDALPPAWQTPDSTPAIGGKGTLPYEADAALEIPHFSITLKPGAHQLRVSYSAKPTSYATGGSPRLYWQLAYILAPAREWAGFGGLDVQVQLPKGWRFASTLPLTRAGDQLTGSFGELPADAIAMTAQARGMPIVGAVVFWSSKLLLLACVVGGPVILWRLGRRIGRLRGRRLRSVLWALAVSPFAGILWMVALIVCLVLAFQADLFVTESLQRSQNYANVYFLFYVGILCTLAFPVGLIITLAGAIPFRVSVAAAGKNHADETQE
ncbi:MAG: hypothetical protein H8E44_09975 [Planctomycetes bacterium]|nr:hypothetical protein [Planctomycetota bacterium]MBL7041976.1 hypothetical protein [Pirellulaceae bacterium]